MTPAEVRQICWKTRSETASDIRNSCFPNQFQPIPTQEACSWFDLDPLGSKPSVLFSFPLAFSPSVYPPISSNDFDSNAGMKNAEFWVRWELPAPPGCSAGACGKPRAFRMYSGLSSSCRRDISVGSELINHPDSRRRQPQWEPALPRRLLSLMGGQSGDRRPAVFHSSTRRRVITLIHCFRETPVHRGPPFPAVSAQGLRKSIGFYSRIQTQTWKAK